MLASDVSVERFGDIAKTFAGSADTDIVNITFGRFGFPVTAAGKMDEFVRMMRENEAVVLYHVGESEPGKVLWLNFNISAKASVLRWFFNAMDVEQA